MRKNSVLHVFFGAGVALALALVLAFGAAILIWFGTIPAGTPSIALNLCMGMCAFIGGRIAIGRGGEPILTGIATGVVLACVMLVVCLCLTGVLPFHGRYLATGMLTLSGGALSGLFGEKKKRKKKKKK